MSKNELCLYGSVGASWWGEDWFSASQVRQDLEGRSGPLTVRINSGGGIASEGQAIYALLRNYPDQVNVVIEGAAMSAASLIAMAGDTITMTLGSFLMIHDPAQWYMEGRGTEDDHLKLAKQLAITANGYAAIYAKRSGKTVEEAREVMRVETLLDGAMAVAEGFATVVDEGPDAMTAAVFDYRLYKNAPVQLREASEKLGALPGQAAMATFAGMPRMEKETKMNTPVTAAAPVAPQTQAPAAAVDTKAVMLAERQRINSIDQMLMVAKLPADKIAALRAELVDGDADVTMASAKITAEWQKLGDLDQPMHGQVTAKVTRDASDKFVEGATKAVLAKVSLPGGERNEFSSLSLREMARESIIMMGGSGRFEGARELVGAAFTMVGGHGTSDFTKILANIQGKAVLKGWEEAPETFEAWTKKGSLNDFKSTTRAGVGTFPALPLVRESAAYEYVTVGDRAEPIALATYGSILRITRQAIINDDLSILGDMPRKMGRAAKATVGDIVYAILTNGAATNMSDGNALFYAGGGNLQTGGGSVLQVSSLSAAKAAMRTQKDGTRVLNVGPKYLIVPAALELTAEQLINSSVDPRDNKGHASNPVAGMAEIVVDGRLDAASVTAWYMAADAGMFDTIEVAYLDGNDAPFIEEQTAWTADGVELKVRIDAAAAALDRRTLYRSAGA
jgi:ATP-dependent protease ClpP protease subunit